MLHVVMLLNDVGYQVSHFRLIIFSFVPVGTSPTKIIGHRPQCGECTMLAPHGPALFFYSLLG